MFKATNSSPRFGRPILRAKHLPKSAQQELSIAEDVTCISKRMVGMVHMKSMLHRKNTISGFGWYWFMNLPRTCDAINDVNYINNQGLFVFTFLHKSCIAWNILGNTSAWITMPSNHWEVSNNQLKKHWRFLVRGRYIEISPEIHAIQWKKTTPCFNETHAHANFSYSVHGPFLPPVNGTWKSTSGWPKGYEQSHRSRRIPQPNAQTLCHAPGD